MRVVRALWLAILFGVVLLAQSPDTPKPEQYPGQHNHDEPPAGWYCAPDHPQADHRCACSNMPAKPDDPDDPVCQRETVDDSACSAYCHKDHCACAHACRES